MAGRPRSDMSAARTCGAISRSTRKTASCSCRPARRPTTSTAAIARATICSATACSRSTRGRGSGSGTSRSCITICGITTTPRAPKLLTVQHNGKPIDIVAQAGKTGLPLRVRAEDRQAAMADRRAAGAQEQCAGRVLVADAAVSDQTAAVRAAVDDAGGSHAVRQRRRAGEAEAARARSGK